jgi:hypothetical protein
MIAKQWFRYVATPEHVYELGIEYYVANGRVKLVGCDMYKASGEYVGKWYRSDMTAKLIRECERWVRGDPSFANYQLNRPMGRKPIK